MTTEETILSLIGAVLFFAVACLAYWAGWEDHARAIRRERRPFDVEAEAKRTIQLVQRRQA